MKKVALALSGGGIRAAAHLGVAEVLMREGYVPEVIAGSSGGALAGVLLCDGKSPSEVLELFRSIRKIDLLRPSRRGGMFSLNAVEARLSEHLGAARLEALPTHCIIAATDLVSGRIVYLDEGPAARLAAASSSLVPFFAPVPYEQMKLCDGGFMDNMPTVPLEKFGLPIIGVNVNPILPQQPVNLVQTTYRALVLMMAANIEASKKHADLYVEVEGCADINIFDLSQIDHAYRAGTEAAQRALSEHSLPERS